MFLVRVRHHYSQFPCVLACFSFLYSEIQSYFCAFKYLTSAWITLLLKSLFFPLCADIALVSYSALQVLHTCLVCLFGMIAYIFILGEIGYPLQFYLLVRDTRINKQFEQLCHETDSSISLAFPAPNLSLVN